MTTHQIIHSLGVLIRIEVLDPDRLHSGLECRMGVGGERILESRGPVDQVGDKGVLEVLEISGVAIGGEGEVGVGVPALGLILGLAVDIDGDGFLLESDSHLRMYYVSNEPNMDNAGLAFAVVAFPFTARAASTLSGVSSSSNSPATSPVDEMALGRLVTEVAEVDEARETERFHDVVDFFTVLGSPASFLQSFLRPPSIAFGFLAVDLVTTQQEAKYTTQGTHWAGSASPASACLRFAPVVDAGSRETSISERREPWNSQ